MELCHAPAVQIHCSNWNIVKMIGGVPWPYPADGAAAYIGRRLAEAETREVYFWGIFLNAAPDVLIGAIEYRFYADEDENRGFWLGEDYWGQGIMTQAVALTQDFVFFELGKTKVIARSLTTNHASNAVKRKTGGRVIGESTDDYYDGPRAEYIWEITPETWARAKRAGSKKGEPLI